MSDSLELVLPCTVCGRPAARVTIPRTESVPALLVHLDSLTRTIMQPVLSRVLGMLERWQLAGGSLERDLPAMLSRAVNVRCGGTCAGQEAEDARTAMALLDIPAPVPADG